MQNSISVSISSTNSLTNDLKNTESTINKILESLDGDLSGLGQADRDLRTYVLRTNGTYFDGKMNMQSNFDVTEFSVNEASTSVVSKNKNSSFYRRLYNQNIVGFDPCFISENCL